MPGEVHFHIDPEKLPLTLHTDKYAAYAKAKLEAIKARAESIFNTLEKKDNEQRTSEYTPPHYRDSFETSFNEETLEGKVMNTDPGWYLVEFGAHHPGTAHHPGEWRTVPKYAPLRTALDSEAATGE